MGVVICGVVVSVLPVVLVIGFIVLAMAHLAISLIVMKHPI